MWANWYAGITPGEDRNNYVVLTTSGDDGSTWQETLVIDPDGPGPVRTFDPELWLAPNGTLYVFWAQAEGHDGTVSGVWAIHTTTPDKAQPEWSSPQRLTDGIMMCKPIVLSTGEWVLPVSTWRKTDFSARVIVSTDEGKNWSLRGACQVPPEVRQFDEHMLIERKDGSLWMLVRTNYGIGEAVSQDRGKTWSELTPTNLPHPSARFFITRLHSGNLLLVKHGGLETKTGRSHLTAFVSSDDGQSWQGGLLLDERNGVSYPDGQQTADGVIHIIYDFERTRTRHILLASFTEQDVAAGKPVSDQLKLARVVSQASGGQEKKQAAVEPVKPNADGAPLLNGPTARIRSDKAESAPFTLKTRLFTDRSYTLAELPEPFQGAQFLQLPLDGQKQLRCETAGVVWLLTPHPERNKDSQARSLIEQGFVKAALPEVRLFNPSSPANYCTVYQKQCAAGEEITVGKWAVPVVLGNRR